MKNSLLKTLKKMYLLLSLLIIGSQSFCQSSWTHLMPKPLGFLTYDASYIDANNGIAVGESGCFAKTTNGGSTWTYNSLPLYTGNGLTNFRPTIYQCQYVTANIGYAVGSNGTFLKTTNGGTTWNYQNGPLGPVSSSALTMYNIYFFDANNGWVIGDAINTASAFIYRTTDGGVTWTAATGIPATLLNSAFYGIDFVNPFTGYVCGQSGKAMKTIDGGATWTDISLTTTNYTVVGGGFNTPRTQYYRCIIAIDANTAIMSSQNNGCILRTTNGGTSWYASANQNVGLPQVATWQMAPAGPNKDTIVVAGGSGVFAKSVDKGLTWTWTQHYTGPANNNINYYYAINAIPGVPGKYALMGASGMTNITNDGGSNWTNPYFSLGTYGGYCGSNATNLFDVSFVNANYGMVVGAHGTLGTTPDGGTTWVNKSIASMNNDNCSPDYIYGVRTPSLTNTFICTASNGLIMKSTDFGDNWTTQVNLNGSNGFSGMDFFDNNNGWACTWTGKVYYTKNGTTWASVNVTTTQLNGIRFLDANNGWVVGNSGKIYYTTNGGTVWAPQTSGITNALNSIQFLNINTGFACGGGGRVLVTTDGGVTWIQRNVTGSPFATLNKVLFFDNLRGMVFSNGGASFVTADGGLNWNPFYAPTSDVLQAATVPPGTNRIVVAGGSLFGVHGDVLNLDNSQCAVTILTQPANTSVCAGTTANFNVTISGSIFASYQWQVSTDGGVTFNNIAGATTSSYSFTPNGTETGYQYRCQVTNSCGSPTTTNSNAATLTFNTQPAVTVQPVSTTACLGGTATFTSGGTGTSITYQWQVSTNGGTSYSNIFNGTVYAGVNTTILTLLNVVATMNNYKYRCLVNGVCLPSGTSSAATLTISVIINTQPVAVTQCAGGTANFSVVASGPVLAYQWQVSTDLGVTYNNITDGGVYSGSSTANLSITGTTGSLNGNRYRCVVSGSGCIVNGTGVILTVNTPPVITTQPVATTAVCAGQNVTLGVTVTGTAITYQWQLSTDGGATFNNVINGGLYSGATSATLNITGVLATMNNYIYKCVISGTCTPAATSANSVISISTPVTITAQPLNNTVCAGNTATFSVTTTGTVSAYQWQVSTLLAPAFANIPGANASSYTVGTSFSMTGNMYRCIITTVCTGNITSGTATLFVNQNPVITLTTSPTVNMYPGIISTISISNISPAAGVNYQWYRNGVLMPGATGTSIQVGVDDIGSYVVSVTDVNGCTASSSNILINQIDAGKLFIYPNPNSGKFQVRLFSGLSNLTPRRLIVFDGKGSMVYSQAYPINGSYERMDVDLRTAASGIYVVVILDNSGAQVARGKVMIY